MTLKNLTFSVALCLLAACNNQTDQTKTITPAKEQNALACYSYIHDKDTVLLKTIDINGAVTGTLVYNFYEKDKNKGTIQGQMTGDLLIADYTFFSEGTQSVRQVAFKKSGTGFTEGYGEQEDKNGKLVFKNTGTLSFNHSILLTQANCEK